MQASTMILCFIYFIVVRNVKDANCKVETKIIGGKPTDIKSRPFMLSLHNAGGFVCGASILSRNWGITAFHCLDREKTNNYFVRAGSNSPDEGGSLHILTRIHVYNDTRRPYWLSGMLYHDVALFEVKPRFRFSRTVKAIRLPREFCKPPKTLYVSGWGYTSFHDRPKVSDVLMGVCVNHTPYEVCINETPEYQILVKKEYHLCYGALGKDSCYGDSGGPLASRNTIYGIVSFGQNCGVVSGVYENVCYYRQWIKDLTNL